MRKSIVLLAIVIFFVFVVAITGCGRGHNDKEDWGTVAAELDSLQAAQKAFKDSLRVKKNR